MFDTKNNLIHCLVLRKIQLRSGMLLLVILWSLHPLLGQQEGTFRMRQVGTNNLINGGWEMLWGPDDQLWITERIGKAIYRVDPGTGVKDLLYQFTNVIQDASQNGVLGMALHPDLGKGLNNDYVYVSYTYEENGTRGQKIVRLSYTLEAGDGVLSDEVDVLAGLPTSNDHNSGRLIIGPDQKLYYTIGDQGANRSGNACNPVLSQVLPSQQEVDATDYEHYAGKTLRINLDGAIPDDNPVFNGVVSHVYTYGHRNAQGLVFSSEGILYSNEHGDNTDDEVNLLSAGGNYGWPYISGYQDDQVYQFCNYSEIENCDPSFWDNYECHPEGSPTLESAWTLTDFVPPIATMFTVGNDYDFFDPSFGSNWIGRPNVAPSSIDIYENDSIPGWENSLLVISLKRGRIYRYNLSEDGLSVDQNYTEHWNTINRYRDIAIHPDGNKFYVLTDASGGTEAANGLDRTSNLQHPGSILEFSYELLDEDNTLLNLSVNAGDLEPAFDPDVNNYTVVLPEGTDSFEVSAETSSSRATLNIGAFEEIPGTDTIRVTSESGVVNEYVIAVQVAEPLSVLADQRTIEVFPSPFSSNFQVRGEFRGDESLDMFDLSGKHVFFDHEYLGDGYLVTPHGSRSGLYILKLTSDTRAHVFRLIKK